MENEHGFGFATRAIHGAHRKNPLTGAIIPSIDLSVTFAQEKPGDPHGFEYARVGNPSRDLLEAQLALLEGAKRAVTFSSGLAAEDALLRSLCQPGDTVLLGTDVYGGTYRLLTTVFAKWGVTTHLVDTSDIEALQAAVLEHSPRVVWVETPSNPLLRITDIAAAKAASAGATLVVDSTLASPYLQQPLRQGADVVVHSSTKYLAGHSDVMGGVVLTNDEGLADDLAAHQSAAGAVLSPFEAWLTLRGMKTLALRMDTHCENALAVAQLLQEHPQVTHVYYPGLPDHPGHHLAAAQMSGFSGMVSFVLANEEQAQKFVTSTALFSLAGSLGSVDSLVNHPATMTHAAFEGTEYSVSRSLVRLSVGVEDVGDLLGDVRSALANVGPGKTLSL